MWVGYCQCGCAKTLRPSTISVTECTLDFTPYGVAQTCSPQCSGIPAATLDSSCPEKAAGIWWQSAVIECKCALLVSVCVCGQLPRESQPCGLFRGFFRNRNSVVHATNPLGHWVGIPLSSFPFGFWDWIFIFVFVFARFGL